MNFYIRNRTRSDPPNTMILLTEWPMRHIMYVMTQKEVILLALKKAQGMPLEQAAEEISNFLDIASELMGHQNQPQAAKSPIVQPHSHPVATQEPPRHSPPPTAMPRILPQRPVDFQFRRVEDIREYLDREAPATITVTLNDSNAPITLFRRVQTMEPLKCVKLSYGNPASDPDAPFAMFRTTDETIGLDDAIQEIMEAAKAQLRSKPKELTPRQPSQVKFDPSSGDGGIGGDADETAAGGTIVQQWASNRTPEEVRFRKG